MILRQTGYLLLLFLLTSLALVNAQSELPDEIFSRTLLIRGGNEMATAFKFYHGGRMYLVTTRHVCESLPLKGGVIQVWHGSWIDLKTVRTIFPAVKDVDLAILETDAQIERHYKVVNSSEVLTTGQKVWYMGWLAPTPHPTVANAPHTSRPLFPEVPMVKTGTISAINPLQADSFQIHFDGGVYNNRIATGPVVYWSSTHKDFEVLGVIKRNERDAVRSSLIANNPQEIVKSDTLHAYSIDVVIETIRGDPQR
jgi:hypothetical protein